MQSSDTIFLLQAHAFEADVSFSVPLRYPPLAVELKAGRLVIDRSIACLSYLGRLFVTHTPHFHCRRHVAVLELSSIVAQCKSQASARFSLGDTGLCISLEVLSGVSDIEKFKGGEGSARTRSMCLK